MKWIVLIAFILLLSCASGQHQSRAEQRREEQRREEQQRRSQVDEHNQDRREANVDFQNNDNGDRYATCGSGWFSTKSWLSHKWTYGGIRTEYYISQGQKRDMPDCIKSCDRIPTCYFATMTPSNNCWLLTTDSPAACRYMRGSHYGSMGERCTEREPCQGAYRVCKNPDCTLLDIQTIACKTNNEVKAVEECTNTFV